MKTKDFRINNRLSMGEYEEIAEEYLAKIGRKSSGYSRMSATHFETTSDGKYTEKRIAVIINYAEQTIELIER